MASCKLIIEDEVNIKIEGLEIDVRRKLANALKFEVPYAKYMPQYKLGRWDGKVAFFGIGGTGYVNHLDVVSQVLQKNNVEITKLRRSTTLLRIHRVFSKLLQAQARRLQLLRYHTSVNLTGVAL